MSQNIYLRYQEGLVKSLIAQPEMVSSVVGIVTSDDFGDPNYKLVYEAIVSLYLAHEPISLAGITLEISKMGGGVDPTWLLQLDTEISIWVAEAPAPVWAELLRVEHAKVKAQETMLEVTKTLSASDTPIAEIMSAVRELEQIYVGATKINQFNIKDSIQNYVDERERDINGDRTRNVIYSPYPTIDHFVGGWKTGELVTVGARTSVGKTVFATNCVSASIAQGKSTLFFSLEMSEKEVFDRLISAHTMIPLKTLSNNLRLTNDEQIAYNEATEYFANSSLILNTDSTVTIENIRAQATMTAQSEGGLDFIVIDYLQLIENKNQRNRQEAVAEVSREIKKIAKDFDVPVMVLVQMQREASPEEADIPPQMYQIRESGAIAQDSSVVIVLHRNILADEDSIDPKTLFIINKNRQGEVGKYINVRTRVDCNLFIDDTNANGIKQRQMLEEMVQRGDDNESEEYSSADIIPDTSSAPETFEFDIGDEFNMTEYDYVNAALYEE